MQNRLRPAALALLVIAPAALAQDPCEGNHLGPVYLETGPAYLGGSFEIDLGSPAAPLGTGLLSVSDGYGPVFHPLLGEACLDVFSPFYQVIVVPLDATGNWHLSLPLPSDPALLGQPPIYAAPTALVGGQIWNGKTLPLYYTFADSWTPTEALPEPRALMEATNLGDGPQDDRIQVFVSGGGTGALVEPESVTAETWIYQPLDRTILAGPTMAVERVGHSQTKLADGRILIAGGNDTAGVCHASGAIYDHAAGTLTPTAPMSAPRSGHAATLLADGRVLVTGGLADFQDAGTALIDAMNTAQDTAEIYDPAADTWTPVAGTMSAPRAGHEQVTWHDGRILVVSGSDGGTVAPFTGNPTISLTGTCDWFDPATGLFSPAPTLQVGRAWFGASLLGSGELLVSGGLADDALGGSALASNTTYLFDGATWTQTGIFVGLPIGVAFHTQATRPDGSALIVGGFTGYLDYLEATASAIAFDGATTTTLRPVGESDGTAAPAAPRGGHTMTEMWDGTWLVLGGMAGSTTTTPDQWALDDGFVYAP